MCEIIKKTCAANGVLSEEMILVIDYHLTLISFFAQR